MSKKQGYSFTDPLVTKGAFREAMSDELKNPETSKKREADQDSPKLHDWEVAGQSDYFGRPDIYRCLKCNEQKISFTPPSKEGCSK